MSKPKMSKVCLCKELESNIFDYGVLNAANLMRTTQEKIGQYVGITHDLANKLTNKTTVTIPPPVYSTAILLRHQEWERHVRRKQKNMRTAYVAFSFFEIPILFFLGKSGKFFYFTYFS